MVLPTFAAQAVRGEPLTVFGNGEQSRCFAHVKDVVEAIQRLIETPAAIGFEDMQRRVPDVGKLGRTIGFPPTTSLEHIIADVVAEQRRLAVAG
jgi:UDP-glucose 4-epimerase